MLSASDALERLKEGNKRFVNEMSNSESLNNMSRRCRLEEKQEPFAIILGCSDSRVPAEIVFDQGLGDLFVIRVAGNIVAPSQVGSVEFAVEQFGTKLVVVLGHSRCGAVKACIDAVHASADMPSKNVGSIVNRIRPIVETLAETELGNDDEKLMAHAVKANIRSSVDHLSHGSKIIEQKVGAGELTIVGAEYSLDSGVVNFF
ncbi:carbonic anhydrase [Teredinibacter sp. KSP-S5-2]|uniref:carbonic anhydrase n=1 Tax=Teredinibacter sp. KSP-S5-2 TaxID=3034506 RepID=UPI002934AF90|nr:carbonic anhydrase [Teredinibacter sp. KSP-S5-2]WNO08872.1 carbonic anhydrase [Teredinibacter sp. KSP-S5-2]